MSKKTNVEDLYTNADKFINLANILVKDDTSGMVGSGLRYASARYTAFELSLSGRDLTKDKKIIKEELLKDYALMLDENLDVYIRHTREKNQMDISKSKLKVFS